MGWDCSGRGHSAAPGMAVSREGPTVVELSGALSYPHQDLQVGGAAGQSDQVVSEVEKVKTVAESG